jgi:hypothetical protein
MLDEERPSMRIFAFDPADYREQYAERGWVHIPKGMTPEFLAALEEFVARVTSRGAGAEQFAFPGKKEQYVYDFGADLDDYPGELFDAVSAMCGLDRARVTMSERHVQGYDEHADPEPAAHKDRYGSQVSMGFSIAIPEASRLVLYPDDFRELNPLNSSVSYRKSLRSDELPEVVLKGARGVELADRAGDVVAFHGNSTWHLRRRSAGAVNLYVKFNDFDVDPLGEDPSTPGRRQTSLELLDRVAGNGVAVVAQQSRQFDKASQVHARAAGYELYEANVWGEPAFPLTPAQFRLLRSLDGTRTWSELVSAPDLDARDLRYLVERGAVDLITKP